jgi:hypothetical protein
MYKKIKNLFGTDKFCFKTQSVFIKIHPFFIQCNKKEQKKIVWRKEYKRFYNHKTLILEETLLSHKDYEEKFKILCDATVYEVRGLICKEIIDNEMFEDVNRHNINNLKSKSCYS